MARSLISPSAVRVALPVLVIVVAALAGVLLGIEIAILVVAAAALVGVIALVWASVQSLTGESPLSLEEALGFAAPSAEEEQKRSVLRALKDLEYERGVGKISEEDYAELSERYRAEAKRLMRSLDESSLPEREKVEKLLAARLLETSKPKAKPRTKAQAEDDEPSPPESTDGASSDTADGSSTPDPDAQPAVEAAEKLDEPGRAREAGGESS
jgi:hypothetical protein